VLITNTNGCRDTSACLSILSLGIIENDLQNDISIFPNSAKDIIHLKTSSEFLNLIYHITDLTSGIILTGKITS
jgi:hypothetical protein